MENVKHMKKKHDDTRMSDVDGLVRDLNQAGYYVRIDELDAVDSGCPQSRKRIYMQAIATPDTPNQLDKDSVLTKSAQRFGA
eukprot:2969153-Pyramimonas_sp.AAC.1